MSAVSAAASGASAAVSATAAAVSAAASAVSAAAAASGKLYVAVKRSGALLVEDKERRQADVREFLLTESNLVTRCDALRRQIRRRVSGCRGCAARHRQRHPGDSHHRYGFL